MFKDKPSLFIGVVVTFLAFFYAKLKYSTIPDKNLLIGKSAAVVIFIIALTIIARTTNHAKYENTPPGSFWISGNYTAHSCLVGLGGSFLFAIIHHLLTEYLEPFKTILPKPKSQNLILFSTTITVIIVEVIIKILTKGSHEEYPLWFVPLGHLTGVICVLLLQ